MITLPWLETMICRNNLWAILTRLQFDLCVFKCLNLLIKVKYMSILYIIKESLNVQSLFLRQCQFFKNDKRRDLSSPVSSLHIYTFVVSQAFMAGAASQAGDADSSRAPGLTSGLQGSVNVHRGALLLVPQWRCISSFVFYILNTIHILYAYI